MDNTKLANIAISLFFLLCCGLAVVNMSRALTPKGLFVKEPVPSERAADLLSKVQLKRFQIGDGEGHVVKSLFEVQNSSGEDVKNIKVLCEFFDDHGEYLNRHLWLLSGVVPSGKTLENQSLQKKYLHTRAASQRCIIADFQVVGRPFFAVHREAGGHGSHVTEKHADSVLHAAEGGEKADH